MNHHLNIKDYLHINKYENLFRHVESIQKKNKSIQQITLNEVRIKIIKYVSNFFIRNRTFFKKLKKKFSLFFFYCFFKNKQKRK